MTLSTLHLAHECKWVNCVSASRAAVRLLRRIPLTMERLHSSRTRESECLCEQKLRKTRNVDETLIKNTGLFSVKIGTSHSEKGRNNFTWWIISWRKMFIQRQKTSKADFIENNEILSSIYNVTQWIRRAKVWQTHSRSAFHSKHNNTFKLQLTILR